MQILEKGMPAAPAPTQGYDTKIAAVKARLAGSINESRVAAITTPPMQTAPGEPKPEPAQDAASPTETAPGQGDTVVEAAAPPEAPKPEEPAKAPEEPISAQYAALARREQQMRQEARKLKAERDAFKAEQEALKPAPKPSLDESKYVSREKLRENALAILAEEGISYDTLTQQALNAPTHEQVEYNNTIRELRNEIKALKEGHEKVNKTFEQQQQDGYKQAVAQIRNDVSRLVKQGDNFELIRHSQATGDVVELIERTFKEGLGDEHPAGTLLSVEEAAQMVENHLEEQALKFSKLKKIQAKLQPAAVTPATPAKVADPSNPKQTQVKTLTNSIGTVKQYSAKERALLAAQYGPNWRTKVG